MDLGYVFGDGEEKPTRKKIVEDDYDKISLIGGGSFGKVFLVRNKESKRLYAMKKQLKKHIIDQTMIDKIMEEKRLLCLLPHPFIIRLYCSFHSRHNLFLIFEIANGGDMLTHINDLGDFLPFENGFTEERSRFYAAQIYLAVKYLHDNQVMYRDLKPENILISKEGNIKLCDLGLSKQISRKFGETHITANTICGTQFYLAPEMVEEMQQKSENSEELVSVTPYTKSIDWWSFGILVCQFLFGENPFGVMYDKYMYYKDLKKTKEQKKKKKKKIRSSSEGDNSSRHLEAEIEGEEEEEDIDYQIYFSIIFQKKLRFPPYNKKKRKISNEAKDFVRKLLNIDPKKRLGYDDEREIMNHPFFFKTWVR